MRALVLSALFAALASFFVMTRSGIGNAQIGDSYALSSITAAVLGGAALSGGRATFIGANGRVGAPGADHRRAARSWA